MKITFTEDGWQEYLYWQANDKRLLKKLNEIIKALRRDPYEGMGKPEPLKYKLQGCWSRRLDQEHRIVYIVKDDSIEILSCRFHY